MFDISFSELLLIAVVALLAFGPDKLPEVARSLGRWIGRARHLVTTVKHDLDRELRLDELRQSIRQGETEQFHKMMEDTKNSLNSVKDSLNAPVEIPTISSSSTDKSHLATKPTIETSSTSDSH